MAASDRRYVVATWAHSARPTYGRGLPRAVQLAESYRIVDALLAAGRVAVMVIAGDHAVHAWCAGNVARGCLHYAYVAPELRRAGLARRLVSSMFGDGGPALSSLPSTACRLGMSSAPHTLAMDCIS